MSFELVDGPINKLIDDAYKAKYKGSRYLSPMIGKNARAATVKVVPERANNRDQERVMPHVIVKKGSRAAASPSFMNILRLRRSRRTIEEICTELWRSNGSLEWSNQRLGSNGVASGLQFGA